MWPQRHLKNIISIHAPTRGATTASLRHTLLYVFQSTLPRGERQASIESVISQFLFQSTLPRGERRICKANATVATRFQSTLPRGERRAADHFGSWIDPVFQSTLPRGERRHLLSHIWSGNYISIHAPTRGATLTCTV